MYRIITWINCFKVRLKSKRFIIPIIFALTLLFFPKDTFALEISNVQFYYRGSLVHTFNKNEIQGQYASIDPIEVDALHINYIDVTQKSNYNYQFEGNFDMVGNRLFDTIRSFNINNGVSQQSSSSMWFLYSAEYIEPLWSGNYNITADWTSVNNSNTLSLQFDLGDSLIFYSFRLNTSRLLNDGEDVGDSITNQTQEIIQNQDRNQQQTNERLDSLNKTITDSFTSCNLKKEYYYYSDDVSIQDNYLNVNGNLVPDVGSGITDYISVLSNTAYNIIPTSDVLNLGSFCLYDSSKNLISCEEFKKRLNINFNTQNAKYIRISITGSNARPLTLSHNVCKNRIDETNEKLDSLDKTLNDDNVSGATSTGNDFFDNFILDDNGGISSIVTLPLRVIRGLISGENNCSALNFEILGTSVYFPGGCIMWDNVSNANEILFQTIICGFFGYILLTKLFKDIEDLKNPNKEEVSTLDL